MQNFQVLLQSMSREELENLDHHILRTHLILLNAFDSIDKEAARYCIPVQFIGYLYELINHEQCSRFTQEELAAIQARREISEMEVSE